MTTFNPPRKARVIDAKFRQHGSVLMRMGLAKQEFRAVGEENGNIVVHPDDLSSSKEESFTLRRDIVEFPSEES